MASESIWQTDRFFVGVIASMAPDMAPDAQGRGEDSDFRRNAENSAFPALLPLPKPPCTK